MTQLPRLLFTLGDVAGIGPELIVKAWPALLEVCRPVIVGDPGWLTRYLPPHTSLEILTRLTTWPATTQLICLPGSAEKLEGVEPGKVNRAAGQAAFDFLNLAIDLVLANQADGLVTLPWHKEGLMAAGQKFPGHTEILAARTGTTNFGMMLFARGKLLPRGLGVVHVTLHMGLRDIFGHITQEAVVNKIRLLDGLLQRLGKTKPRLGVAALNPHAGDGGLFGDEEAKVIAPAVAVAQRMSMEVSGPHASDTLFLRASQGEFDGIVAMYHDQGHIPLKLLSGLHAVNITLGLPIIRTSVAHGTAYDIVGKGLADPGSLIEAARVAALLVRNPTHARENPP